MVGRVLKRILVAVVLVCIATAADARFPRGGSASGGFNGGKTQSNLSGIQVAGNYPFINQLKHAQPWSIGGFAAPVTPDLLDDDGYPLATIPNGITTVFYVPRQADRPGRYAITWDGNGTIFTGMSASGATGSKTSSSGSGRYEFLPGETRFVVGIDTVGSPRITNMRVFHVDDEAALTAGEVFSAYFKNKWREGKIGVIRPLGWGGYSDGYNRNMITKWSDRKPQSYVFYDGYEIRSGNYAGSTSLTAQAYSVGDTPDGFSLTDKAWFHALFAQSYPPAAVTFTNGSANVGWPSHGLSIHSRVAVTEASGGSVPPINFATLTTYYVVSVPDANTITLSATQGGSAIVAGSAGTGSFSGNAQFTMNVNGTGAKWVLSEHLLPVTDYDNSRPIGGNSQSLATFVYDSSLDVYIKYGGDQAYNSQGMENGVPPELQMRLAVEIGAHLWLPMPYFTMDPVTDYVPEVISMIKNYPGASWMIPRIEPPNEIWNRAAAFWGTPYASAKAAVNWPSTGANDHDWYGKVLSTLGQTVANQYGAGGLGTTYHVMLGVQTFSGTYLGDADPRATASKYVAQSAGAQSLTWSGGTINYTKSAASDWASHVAPANYFSPSEYQTGTADTRAAAFEGVRFVASINAGTMTVSQIDTPSGTLAIGKTVFGRGIANNALLSGITITGGSAPTWTLSSSITLASDTFYAGADMTQPGLFIDSLGGAASGFNLAANRFYFDAWKAWAAGFGINKMSAYEGLYSPDCSSYQCTSQLDILKVAGKWVASSPGSPTGLQGYLYGNTPSNFSDFLAAGGEYPSVFIPTGAYPVDNIWSVLDDIYAPDPPQWKAIKSFNWLLKRDLYPASNDNDPMWLEKAA